MAAYVNLCTECNLDFTGEKSFDRHRTGKHAYSFTEGTRKDPPVWDGRRCMNEDEMREAGMELSEKGRWRLSLSKGEKQRLSGLRNAA